MSNISFVGLDVHAETIAVAIAEPGEPCVRWGSSRTGWNRFANSSESWDRCNI